MKKSVVVFMLAIVLIGQAQTPVQASNIETKEEQHVAYRVYVDNEVVGVISDKAAYDTFLETKMRTLLKENPGQVIHEPTNVTIQEELILLPVPSANDEAVLKLVEEKANFKTSAHLVTVGGGKYSFAVSDLKPVEDTVNELMAYYTSDKDFKRIKDAANQKEEIKSLDDEGSQYIGVKTSEEFAATTGVAAAEDVLSAEEARRFILYGQTEPKETVVFDEDSSLWYIARDFGLTEEELVLLNPGVDELKWSELLGLELDVTPLNPITSVVTEEETVNIETVSYETEYIDDDSMAKGQTTVKQEGENGEHLTRTKTTYTDGVDGITEVLDERNLSEPVNKIVVRGTKVIPNVGNGSWVWPTTSRSITNGYLGYSGHYALDIDAYTGQPIFAADNGVVVSAGWDGAYGYSVLINHKNGYYSRYAHLSTVNVSAGQTVEGGQTIGGAGSTGNSTGTHLHFEIRTNTGSQPSYAPNPLDFY